MSRFFPDYDPLKFNDTLPPYADRPFPGVCWMKPQGSTQAFYARLRFTLNEKTTIRFHVSGDRWFDLRLDGQFITDGPECSDSAHWCYSSFEEELMPGEHEFFARIVMLPAKLKPWNAMGGNCGFFFFAEAPFTELLSTGAGAWEFAIARSLVFPEDYGKAIYRLATGIPAELNVSLAEKEWNDSDIWNGGVKGAGAYSALNARHFSNRPCMLPARLPEQLRKKIPIELPSVTVPAGEKFEKIIDLGTYCCFQAEVRLSGSGKIRFGATEALCEFESDANGWHKKVARNVTENAMLNDWNYDTWIVENGSGSMLNTFFRSGKLIVLQIEAGEQAVVFEGATLWERRYPWDFSARIEGDPEFAKYEELCRRALENCTHSIFMDCPFYERLMYIGDARVQALIANTQSRDRRLQRKAIELLDWSRDWRGLTASSYPAGDQTIPGFALIWIAFCHDTLMWSSPDAIPLIRERLRGVRAVIDAWENERRGDGWITSLQGWNFVSAETGRNVWKHGVPQGGEYGEVSPVLNMFYLHFSQYAEKLERFFGDDARADWLAGTVKAPDSFLQKSRLQKAFSISCTTISKPAASPETQTPSAQDWRTGAHIWTTRFPQPWNAASTDAPIAMHGVRLRSSNGTQPWRESVPPPPVSPVSTPVPCGTATAFFPEKCRIRPAESSASHSALNSAN